MSLHEDLVVGHGIKKERGRVWRNPMGSGAV